MPNPFHLGFFIQPVHPPSRRYADVLREDREAVVLADRLGYREAFIGEHLVDTAETITSSLAFIAHLAEACPSIRFGTGVLPLATTTRRWRPRRPCSCPGWWDVTTRSSPCWPGG